MGEDLYREIMGLDETAPLPTACDCCDQPVDDTTRHLVVVIDQFHEGGDDRAYCLHATHAQTLITRIAECVEEGC